MVLEILEMQPCLLQTSDNFFQLFQMFLSRTNRQHFAHCSTTSLHWLDMCGKLPGTFALLAVLIPGCTQAQLSSFYHLFILDVTLVKRYQALLTLPIIMLAVQFEWMVVYVVVEHWRLNPGALGSIPNDCWLFTFLYFLLLTSKSFQLGQEFLNT